MARITDDVQPEPHVTTVLGRAARPQSRGEQLADRIRTTIRQQQMSEGDFFGTLESIRADTGLARTTVSEAVKLLRDRGVLIVKPGRHGGLFVAKTTPLVRLRHTLMSVDGDEASAAGAADAIELRDSLEDLIAAKAVQHRTAADVSDLNHILDDMRAADDWDDFMHNNWRLHRRIAQICPNAMARAVYESTLGFLTGSTARRDDQVDDAYWAGRLHVHEDLVAAIATGDEQQAAQAVAAHRA